MTAILTLSRPQNLRIAVDVKNFALFTGGIAAFFAPLLEAWIELRPDYQFVLVGPKPLRPIAEAATNVDRHSITWPHALPRPMRHPVYDNLLFPLAIRAVQPDLIFTPYHDVRLPRGTPSVMMVHDTCLHDLPEIYPQQIRGYYLHMLRRNLRLARHTLTVSNTSRKCIQQRYGVSDNFIGVIPNAIDPSLNRSSEMLAVSKQVRRQRGLGVDLFYPGGSEFRKNITRLAEAVKELVVMGANPRLWITGDRDRRWDAAIGALQQQQSINDCFRFLGRLDMHGIAREYLACDVVVYPTLCEGFGRVALEAMQLGKPLACSNIAVLREVARDYPEYFDPLDSHAMAAAIIRAANSCREPRLCSDYLPESVSASFIDQMDAVISELRVTN